MRLPTGRCNSPVRAKETPPFTRFVFELKQVVTRQSHRSDHLAFSYTDPGLLSMVRGLNMRRIGEREQASNLQKTSQPVLRTPTVQMCNWYQMSKKDDSFKVLHNLAADLCHTE